MLAHNYVKDYGTNTVVVDDLENWFVSEKLDGFRAVWDGKKFWSRSGKPFHAHSSFTAIFPRDVMLDGELYIGREKFENHGVIRKKNPEAYEWENAGVKFHVFDIITDGSFQKRYELLECFRGIPNMVIVEHGKIRKGVVYWKGERYKVYGPSGTALDGGLMTKMKRIHAEGLMLRHPDSFYEFGKRSKRLLKLKQQHDAEAIVFGYEPGKGKHEGRLGALWVRWQNKEFMVGTGFDDIERDDWEIRYPFGSQITFGYYDTLASGVPRFPSFLRVRVPE